MSAELPKDLNGWKGYFRDHIEQARRAVMTDRDRDKLPVFLKREVELIWFDPEPKQDAPDDERDRVDAWGDLRYRRER
ncbi:hypothetical protein [Bradyrhizobium nanningense]|nr:hypothetical protein [Bradyrhizobium nanningense]